MTKVGAESCSDSILCLFKMVLSCPHPSLQLSGLPWQHIWDFHALIMVPDVLGVITGTPCLKWLLCSSKTLWPSSNFGESLWVLPLYCIPGLGDQETSRVVSPLLVWPLIKDSKVLIGSISMVVNNCLTWIITLPFKLLRGHKTPTPAHTLQSGYTYGSATYVYYTL